jgi:hypothetical protein
LELSSGIFKLTKLGWLAGQSGLEVESVIWIVAALSPIDGAEIIGPTLLCGSCPLLVITSAIRTKDQKRDEPFYLSINSIASDLAQREKASVCFLPFFMITNSLPCSLSESTADSTPFQLGFLFSLTAELAVQRFFASLHHGALVFLRAALIQAK